MSISSIPDPESFRLAEESRRDRNWKRWGPYLSERQWGTVREDYSRDGNCWDYFPHDHARSRAYRWGEDGLLGWTDRQCRLCFALALWNGQDVILKERLFGLTNEQGNHGEDVKEHYYYQDATPTYSYAKSLYQYPQSAFPYQQLLEENTRRGPTDPEFELHDTGIFDQDRYFDITAEFAKAAPDDILIRITVHNRGPDPAPLHLLPTLWFRNTWSWGCKHEGCNLKPQIVQQDDATLMTEHETLGQFRFAFDKTPDGDAPTALFTENETNKQRLYAICNETPHVKDAFHDYLIASKPGCINPNSRGTKAAPHYHLNINPDQRVSLKFRLSCRKIHLADPLGLEFDQIFETRQTDADCFYDHVLASKRRDKEAGAIARQAYAGLLFSKQFYHYIVEDWLEGDIDQPPPPPARLNGRNTDWQHLYNRDIVSMPDKWEYPWYAAWDLAFHMIPFAEIDPDFAKRQLMLFLREWYMHPNGQIPAYEFALSDVNPPVHAWACWRVYKMTAPRGQRDRTFLASCFQKLLINFTWWVNRKDAHGNHIFSGGFLGMDNIGLFDRSQPLPSGHTLSQADGTAWMGFFCGSMLAIALELAKHDPAYEDMASKFFEHFVSITDAINSLGGSGLWDEEDGFYYDQLDTGQHTIPLRVRSLVGLIPLLTVEVLEPDTMDLLPGFKKRTEWFLKHRPDLAGRISWLARMDSRETPDRFLLAIPSQTRLERVLAYLLDENEFLSPFGIRSLSKIYQDNPYTCDLDGQPFTVSYDPGESQTRLFGGNSNWRGPIWFPINYLIIEALLRYHYFYGDNFKVEYPTGSGNRYHLKEIAGFIAQRLTRLFCSDNDGRRPCMPDHPVFHAADPAGDRLLFHEYFHADTGQGLGASHQTGWTALVTRLLALAATHSADPASPDVHSNTNQIDFVISSEA